MGPVLANLTGQSTRSGSGWVSATPVPYSTPNWWTNDWVPFDVLIDAAESIPSRSDKPLAAGNHFYDVWASFVGSSSSPPAPGFRASFLHD